MRLGTDFRIRNGTRIGELDPKQKMECRREAMAKVQEFELEDGLNLSENVHGVAGKWEHLDFLYFESVCQHHMPIYSNFPLPPQSGNTRLLHISYTQHSKKPSQSNEIPLDFPKFSPSTQAQVAGNSG